MKTLKVNLPGREYQIDIGLNILDKQLLEVVKLNVAEHVVVVTNTTMHDLYPDFIFNVLAVSGVKVSTCVLPDGEQYKNLETLSQIFDFLMNVSANRKTLLYAGFRLFRCRQLYLLTLTAVSVAKPQLIILQEKIRLAPSNSRNTFA